MCARRLANACRLLLNFVIYRGDRACNSAVLQIQRFMQALLIT